MLRIYNYLYSFKIHFWAIILSYMVITFPTSAACSDIVTGKYISTAGTQIILQLVVQSSSPVNIIVEQFFSAENEIIGTRPAAKKISQNGRETKWLLKKIGKGIFSINTTLSKPAKGRVHAVIRYGSTRSGELTELRINP